LLRRRGGTVRLGRTAGRVGTVGPGVGALRAHVGHSGSLHALAHRRLTLRLTHRSLARHRAEALQVVEETDLVLAEALQIFRDGGLGVLGPTTAYSFAN
jgi:hypothetical protein